MHTYLIEDQNIYVTVSRAVFLDRAPIAVVGYQFSHSKLMDIFRNVTQCDTFRDIECYILDNDGYIIASKYWEQTGKFFGEVRGSIMNDLYMDGYYDQIFVYDYQAMCFEPKTEEKKESVGHVLKTVSILYYIVF